MYLDITDAKQGKTEFDRDFGYCGIEGRGGYFFTWMPTLSATLASIDPDTTDEPTNWPKRAKQEVRDFIRRKWAQYNKI